MSAPIGPYQVVRELGRGGMGVVLEVRHPAFGRPLALKLLGAEADQPSPDEEARFAREMQLLAELGHPGVVRVHDAGRDERGRPYMVAELIPGEDLSRLTRTGPLEPRRAAEIARALADTLAHVHGKGIVHRDLKPGNVILTPEGRPVLLDFGLARAAHKERLTRTGAVMGTPAYMAPEQVEGGSVGPQADVYGMGGVLFFLLAGRPPFRGAGMAVLKQVLCDEPEWPSRERPDLPRDLEAICRQAMAKDPAARYPSAAALRDDLDRFLRGEPVAAVPPALPRGLGRLGLVLGSLLVLCGAALTVALSGGAGPQPTTPPPATPGPVRSSLEGEVRTPEQELDWLLGTYMQDWLDRLQVWLERHPDSPAAAKAWGALREAGSREPLDVFRHRTGASPSPKDQPVWWERQVKAFFQSERDLLTCGPSSLQRWEVSDVGRVSSRAQAWFPAGERPYAAARLPEEEGVLVAVSLHGQDCRLELRDPDTLALRSVLQAGLGLMADRLALAPRADGRHRLVLGGLRGARGGRVVALEREPGGAWAVRTRLDRDWRVHAIAFMPDGERLFFSSGGTAYVAADGHQVTAENRIERWAWGAAQVEQATMAQPTVASCLTLDPTGQLLAGTFMNSIDVYGPDLQLRGGLHGANAPPPALAHTGTVRALQLVPPRAPRWLLSSSGDLGEDRGPPFNQIRWWSLAGEEPQELPALARMDLHEPPMQVDVSPAGRWYTVGLPDRVELYAVPPLPGE